LDKNNGGIYKINAETGEFDAILYFPKMTSKDESAIWYNSRVVCSPDNSIIYYLYDNQIIGRELETGKEKVLLENENFARFLDLSPKGEEILFGTIDNELGSAVLQSLELKSQAKENFIYTGRKGENIDIAKWSFEGKGVFFNISYESDGAGSAIFHINKNGDNPRKLWKSENQNSGLSINPAGGQIAFSTFKQEVECWMMSNYRIN